MCCGDFQCKEKGYSRKEVRGNFTSIDWGFIPIPLKPSSVAAAVPQKCRHVFPGWWFDKFDDVSSKFSKFPFFSHLWMVVSINQSIEGYPPPLIEITFHSWSFMDHDHFIIPSYILVINSNCKDKGRGDGWGAKESKQKGQRREEKSRRWAMQGRED